MNELQLQALDLLLNDHFAFWDFGDSFPTFKPAARNSQLDDLLSLVASGLVVVTHGRWIENETAPITLEEAATALRDPSAWLPTGREPGYVLELTELGRKHLASLGFRAGSTS